MKTVVRFLGMVLLSFLLTAITVALIQFQDWYLRNGFSLTGIMPNHFGEPYVTTLGEWITGGFLSPFAWPAVIVIAVIWLVCLVLIGMLVWGVHKKKVDR